MLLSSIRYSTSSTTSRSNMVAVMVLMFILVIAICSSSTVAAAASGASDGGSGRHRMGLPIPKVLPLLQQHQKIHSEMSATQKKKSPRNWLWGQPSNDDDDENDEKQEQDKQEDSETNPDESKNGKSSWKETRKPVQESHPSTKKQGFTRFSIPIFGGMKNSNNNTKTNDDDIDSDSSNTTTTTTPVNNRQLERAKRKQEREERAERQKVEKEETIKARKSMFERAKAARKEKNRNNNNNNNTTKTTTTLDDNNNKTVITLDESNETETSSLANTTAEDYEDDNIKGSSTSANINNGAAPNTIVYSYPQERPRPTMVYRSMPQRHHQSSSSSSMGTTPQGMSPQQALVVTAVASLLSLVSRIWIVMWITKQLGWEEDMIDPVQHFVWECLNDRYVKDEKVLTRALQRAPSGYNKFQWWRHLKSLRSSNSSSRTFVSEYDDNNPPKKILPLKTPARTTVVVNITPNEQLDLSYLSDVVNFLTRVHQSYGFGKDVEVILLLESGGGSVATFGLAASQIARLEHAGMNTTVCVDNIAASGGYMIASQSAQIVIAPFAVVGSIGVQAEFLNFNK
eukprot:scaffold4272_cov98-Cylindrotheca_fusiformis.AAC.5